MPLSLHAISARRPRSLPGRLGRTLFALTLSALLSSTIYCPAQGVGFSTGGGSTGGLQGYFGPSFSTQPANQKTVLGLGASFTVAVSNDYWNNPYNPASFQWQISSDNGNIWTDLTDNHTISGSNTSTLTLSNATLAMTGLQYRATYSGIDGTSNPANLTVLPLLIDVPPGNQTATFGSTVILTTHALSVTKLSYQWFKNLSPIKGATNASLILSNAQVKDDGSYSVKVANALASVKSMPAKVTLTPPAPVILYQSPTPNFGFGGKAILSVHATGTGILRYQWQLNGGNLRNSSNIIGVKTNQLVIVETYHATPGFYSVVVSVTLDGATNSTTVQFGDL